MRFDTRVPSRSVKKTHQSHIQVHQLTEYERCVIDVVVDFEPLSELTNNQIDFSSHAGDHFSLIFFSEKMYI